MKKEKKEIKNDIHKKEKQETIKPITHVVEKKKPKTTDFKKVRTKNPGTKEWNQEKENLTHDMKDNALGQMYKIPGANLDYDEINKMAENHIRDTDELVSESLQNDGLNQMQKAMEGYLKKGEPEIRTIQQMAQKTTPDVVAMAYTNVAKNAGRGELMRLTVIDEKLDFEQPKFEAAFDRIRHFDKEADRVLDWLDAEMGRERE